MEAAKTLSAKSADAPARPPAAPTPDTADVTQKVAWLEGKLKASLDAATTRSAAGRMPKAALRVALVALPVVSALLLGLNVAGLETTFRYAAFALNLVMVPLLAYTLHAAAHAETAEARAVEAELKALLDELEFTAKWPVGSLPDTRKVDALYARYQALAARVR